ncbi:hypothetical protein PIB30_046259 [Stylosanthes scabra]|uniref:Uncharacterized protein n=1 Tax=Stylosanthes scabra TaxID=79078 RepID=A0ABU6XE43_9FABA|nr:hypothetical protein [Stylosanthes scabra]
MDGASFERLNASASTSGRKLFEAFEESIQEFKWHYFKVLQFPSRRPFWLDDEGAPFPWVYWNSESLPAGLGKKSKFRCRWILDHSDAEVGVFLNSLLGDMEKQSQFDRLRSNVAKVEGMGPRSILPTQNVSAASVGASASSPMTIVLPGPSSGAAKVKKVPLAASAEKPICLDVLGDDAAWEHKVNPLDRAFPEGFNFRVALDSGITQSSVREALRPVLPEQLLGTAHRYAYKLTACLQVGIENALSANFKMEKELVIAKDQVVVLTVERGTALTSPPLKAEVDSFTEQLSLAQGERISGVARMSEVEERSKVQAMELHSCYSALEQEKKKVKSLT